MLNVGMIVSGAFRLIKEHPLAVAVWGLAYLATAVVGTLSMGSMLELEAAAGRDNPEAAMATLLSGIGPFFLVQLLLYLLMIVMFTAAMRAVLRPHEGGLAFIRFGMDEVRMIGLTILFIIVFYVGLLLVILLFGALFGAALMATGGAVTGTPPNGGAVFGGVLLMIGVGLVLLFIAIWLYVRLSLAFPLTLIRHKIIVGESWELTKGHALTLFGAYLVIFLILMLVSTLVSAVTMGPYLVEMMGALSNPDAVTVAAQNQMRQMSQINAVTVLGWLMNAAAGGISTALFAGAAATAARALTGDELLAREFA